MIILFEENETEFANLGLGILRDAISCVVKESLNDEFTLSMEYPAKGSNFDKIKENRIIYCKPNPYDNAQAFRINSISKVINGTVTIDAVHISYDTNSIPVKAFSATSLQDVILKIQNGSVVHNPFILTSDIMYSRTYKTTAPYNLRALMLGDEDSIATKYNAEFKFDNYHIYILAKRGADRGAVVRYGHNMTDINHTQTTDLLYNGVYPYYHTETEKTESTSSDEFKQVYIVGSKPFQDGWLSYTKDGEPYHPMDTSPVQIATEGDYYQKVYCWNEIYNVYQEKVYNEMVSLVQGVIEPTWISIDWSKFPKIVCRANKNGYFKKSTDTDWGTLKGVGDIVFESSILNTSTMENMVLYYSEVIPTNTTSENTETSEIVDVQLDDPIMWVETDSAKAMKHNRILMLDLTSEFDEAPTKERLKSKSQEYIIKNKIGTIKHSTTLSFVDLSKTSDHSENENLDHVEIGDSVKVIYEDIGVSTSLRVISTEYDAILGRYNSVELGEKEDKMSSSTVQNGDGVSALTNDVGYASVTTVNKLIADTVNANYIQALNAKLSKAQISQLEVERIDVKGIIEASQFTIDSLVAKLLVADNAEIKDTLTAGNIKVAGDISIKSGSIDIYSDEGTEFRVDREGNVTANSMAITGGTLNIGDGMFEVTNDGIMSARAAQIEGTIVANDGQIGGFTISSDPYKQIHYNNLNDSNSVIVSPGIKGELGLVNDTWAFAAGKKFGVTINGELYASNANITGSLSMSGNFAYHIVVSYPGGYTGSVESAGTGGETADSIISNLGTTSTIKYTQTTQLNGLKYYTRPWGIVTDDQYFNYDISVSGKTININKVPVPMVFGAVSEPNTAKLANTGLTLFSNQRLSLRIDGDPIISYYIDKWIKGTSSDPYHTLAFGNTKIKDFTIYSGNNVKFRPFSFDTSPLSITNFATLTHYYSPNLQKVNSNAIIYIRCGYTEKVGKDQWHQVFTCGPKQKIISATASIKNVNSTADMPGASVAQVYFADSEGNTLYVGNDGTWNASISWIAIIMDTSHV